MGDGKMKNFELNENKQIPYLVCFNFSVNVNLICYCSSQIFELWHIYEGFISYHNIMIQSYILVMRHENILSLTMLFFKYKQYNMILSTSYNEVFQIW